MQNSKLLELSIYQPAFPPQLIENNFNQLIAPAPGMSKLEYAVIQLLPTLIGAGMEKDIAINEAICIANEVLQTIALRHQNAMENQNKNPLSLT